MTGDLLANETQPWYRTAHCPLGSQAKAPAELPLRYRDDKGNDGFLEPHRTLQALTWTVVSQQNNETAFHDHVTSTSSRAPAQAVPELVWGMSTQIFNVHAELPAVVIVSLPGRLAWLWSAANSVNEPVSCSQQVTEKKHLSKSKQLPGSHKLPGPS